MPDIDQLRRRAVSHSLFPATTLKAAIQALGFVQADPIRSPARAQDLILRHRVKDYRAGDLERHYTALDIEEDVLYAYGFLARPVWQLLHPRPATKLTSFERKVLAAVRDSGPTHPNELTAEFGRERVVNAWGGYSKATKHALERLHHHGLLRIARRERGVRIYEGSSFSHEPVTPNERLRKLALAIANVLAPVAEATLLSITSYLRRYIPGVVNHRNALRELLRTGELERHTVDDIAYIWPTLKTVQQEPKTVQEEPRVRFLAPFDPLVWDRRRFEHLWQWAYRFEAYTPPAKRLRGYYAMPLLWGERIIGWANASVIGTELKGNKLKVELGFVEKRPRDRGFRAELDAEIARLEAFLCLGATKVKSGAASL